MGTQVGDPTVPWKATGFVSYTNGCVLYTSGCVLYTSGCATSSSGFATLGDLARLTDIFKANRYLFADS